MGISEKIVVFRNHPHVPSLWFRFCSLQMMFLVALSLNIDLLRDLAKKKKGGGGGAGRQAGINFLIVDSAFSLQLFPRISSCGGLFLFPCHFCPLSVSALITSDVIICLSTLLDCGGSQISLSWKSVREFH